MRLVLDMRMTIYRVLGVVVRGTLKSRFSLSGNLSTNLCKYLEIQKPEILNRVKFANFAVNAKSNRTDAQEDFATGLSSLLLLLTKLKNDTKF